MLLIIGKHLHHIGGREAQHLIKLWLDRNIPTYIESTRHIIQGYRTHTHHEDTLKITLELLEDITIKAIGMGNCMIHFLTTFVEYDIREVVILIDDEIQMILVRLGCLEYQFHLFLEIFLRQDFFHLCLIIF